MFDKAKRLRSKIEMIDAIVCLWFSSNNTLNFHVLYDFEVKPLLQCLGIWGPYSHI